MPSRPHVNPAKRHSRIMIALTIVFLPRILGQLLVATKGVSWLPPMEEWYSGLIPYSILLPIQILILVVMVWAIRDVARGTGLLGSPKPRFGRFLTRFSYVYFGLMAARYIVTMARHPEDRWFTGTIPIWFHVLLAVFVYVWGRHHRSQDPGF